MRYIRFEFGTDYCGTDNTEYQALADSVSDNEINEIANDLANENAEQYTYLATGWDDDWESEEDEASYYEGIWYEWEEISEEEYQAEIE